MVAVKRIQLEGFKEEEVMQLMQEIDLAKQLSHPNIIKYEGMAKDKNTLSIVLECVLHSPAPPSVGFGASSVIPQSLTCVALRVGMSKTGRSSRCSRSLAN